MPQVMYFEDFHEGQTFDSKRSYHVTAAEIIDFGEKYDPQPSHIDEAAGKNTFFSGLSASGWLTAAIVMRLRVEEIRWTHPVRPDDTLRTQSTILEVRRSAHRPEYGVVRSRTTVFNQRDEVVMKSIVNWLAPIKASS